MRLINTDNLELREFLDDENAPPYAILSHTWEKEEVTFQDMKDRHSRPEVQSMIGYGKIRQCCRQAKKDGYAWAWVDTCCIDKSSSAELSEAINSMYRWYQKATVCYAYLSDVTRDDEDFEDYEFLGFKTSRWFTRGWTLQELIAPESVVFYDLYWEKLGTKLGLWPSIKAATGIPEAFLLRDKNITSASIAMRMSWAAKRQTSRVEDRAYSLLGLFDINIPLIYGEGAKAFRRLQEESSEQNLMSTPYTHGEGSRRGSMARCPTSLLAGKNSVSTPPLLGLLARSPADFVDSADFVPAPEARDYIMTSTIFAPPVFLHGGVKFCPRLLKIGSNQMVHHLRRPPIVQLRAASYIALLVQDSRHGPHDVIIPMVTWNKFTWGRKFECLIRNGISKTLNEVSDIFVAPEEQRITRPHDLFPGDIVFRWGFRGPMIDEHSWFETDRNKWEQLYGEQAIVQRRRKDDFGFLGLFQDVLVASWAFKMVDSHKSWSIAIHRLSHGALRRRGALAFSIVRTQTEGKKKAKRMDGHIWHPPLVLNLPSFQDLADVATCRHVVDRETDIWRPEADGLPAGIVLCVETMWDAILREYFEVIDFRFPDGEGNSHFKIPRAD